MEFLFQPGVQAIFDAFSALFSIRIAFHTPEGEELRAGCARRDACAYCRLLRERLGYEDRCRALDQQKRAETARMSGPLAYRCHAGLTEALLPVRDGERLLGFVMIGQFRTHADLPAAVRRRTAGSGLERMLAKAFAEVPQLPPGQLPHLLTLLASLVEYINRQGLIRRHGAAVLENALAFLRANPHRPVSLGELARFLNRSPGTLSNLFRNRTGKSFQQTQSELRLDRAHELLRADPALSVKEAARQTGYADPLYFSRLFTRRFGHPPSIRRSLRGKPAPSRRCRD